MDAAQTIRDAIAHVTALREQRTADPALGAAVGRVKAVQAQRFRGTYADLMASPAFGPAARFFLVELYSDSDYTERDQQFGRIAGTLQTMFPQPVVATAVDLAVLHAQTEALDHAMGRAWQQASSQGSTPPSDAARYAAAWRAVGDRPARQQQLQRVLAMGTDLARLTRTPGLRMMLRMMRAPAQAAGMGALQKFLEAGFDTFGQLARQRGGVAQFLAAIEQRERALMDLLFDADPVTCGTQLENTLGQAR
ncbi:FFLEELY motif protein [Paracidovorax sp. MALMAid1276]|uniref:FFLEELY motif protein n=1 Tax=Paracidovorax sp. MALMAid1276 TaxID=3411631 RepID=UPI003B9A3BD2